MVGPKGWIWMANQSRIFYNGFKFYAQAVRPKLWMAVSMLHTTAVLHSLLIAVFTSVIADLERSIGGFLDKAFPVQLAINVNPEKDGVSEKEEHPPPEGRWKVSENQTIPEMHEV